MKSLHAYIAERNTNYEFRIKVAKQNPKDIMEEIKNALDAYELVSVTAPKSLPVMEHREFPKWGACECWQFEATVAYPTTAVQIAQLLRERTGMQAEWVCVYGKQQADQNDYAEAYGKDHTGALLLDGELKDVAGAQDLVGDRRKDSMLKELEQHAPVMSALKSNDELVKTRAAEKTKPASTTNQIPQGVKSPVGSNQNKITDMRKGKK
jgi:hypothetical protein